MAFYREVHVKTTELRGVVQVWVNGYIEAYAKYWDGEELWHVYYSNGVAMEQGEARGYADSECAVEGILSMLRIEEGGDI